MWEEDEAGGGEVSCVTAGKQLIPQLRRTRGDSGWNLLLEPSRSWCPMAKWCWQQVPEPGYQ